MKTLENKKRFIENTIRGLEYTSTYSVLSSKTGENVDRFFNDILRMILMKKQLFYFEQPWHPNVEADNHWGKYFKRIVLLLLMIRKRSKTIETLLPKCILIKILHDLSNIYLEDRKIPLLLYHLLN
eukprot:TRINITY_DN2590_c0_g1_i2.p1 TRINITY_DN2590_c0_g1~~TRINITY_DN2590_c0_g1_i2.p1  ORF type:complete len:126 (-),score=13.22 TRINITY_DN2590_c0_g1_i2:128-505(-)